VEAVKSIDEIVGANIIAQMLSLEMEQKRLAILIGKTPAYINKLVNGKAGPISKSKAMGDIAKVLHIEEAALYQDPEIIREANAQIGASEGAIARLKEMNRVLGEQLSESLEEIKGLRKKVNSLPAEFWPIWGKADKQLRAVFLYLMFGKPYLDTAISPEIRRKLDLFRKVLAPD